MSVRIKGTTNLLEVNTAGDAQVNLPLESINSGFAVMSAENDAGDVTLTRYTKDPEVSSDYRLRVGVDNMVFNESFPGGQYNTGLWQGPVTTMTITVASGFANLNAGLSVASAAVAMLRTYRHFPCYKQYTTYFEMELQLSAAPVTGNKCEWGAFLASGTTAPTDGAFFRLDAAGEFRCVLSYAGTESQSAVLDTALIGVAETHSYLIYIGSSTTLFWIDNILVAEIPAPAGQGASLASMNIPLAFRNHNSSATSVAQVMKIGNVNVTWGDQSISKPWGHTLAGNGAMSSQGQTGGTMGSTAIYTNAAAAAAAALTNTTAAAQFTGLGGIANVLPTLTAGTDGILFSYQIPVGTNALPGRTLYITGVTIDAVVTTVLVGGPLIYSCALAYGHTAVSLATTESGTNKAPRRFPLGITTFTTNAPVAEHGRTITKDLSAAPIIVEQGGFIQIAARNLGTVTSSGAVTFVVGFTGYWE